MRDAGGNGYGFIAGVAAELAVIEDRNAPGFVVIKHDVGCGVAVGCEMAGNLAGYRLHELVQKSGSLRGEIRGRGEMETSGIRDCPGNFLRQRGRCCGGWYGGFPARTENEPESRNNQHRNEK